jgi:hypothetical protein
MWLGHPLVVLEQSSGELGDTAHRDPTEIKGLNSLALVHVGYLLLGGKRRLGVVEVQIGESITSEEFSGEGFEKLFMGLLLCDRPLRENLLFYLKEVPIRRCWSAR